LTRTWKAVSRLHVRTQSTLAFAVIGNSQVNVEPSWFAAISQKQQALRRDQRFAHRIDIRTEYHGALLQKLPLRINTILHQLSSWFENALQLQITRQLNRPARMDWLGMR